MDGFDKAQNRGWFAGYNFGSLAQVVIRWKAAIAARVNFVATDQYQELSHYLPGHAKAFRPDAAAR